MFNVNHFIVSQVNPHVVPFILDESITVTGSFLNHLFIIIRYLSRQIKQTFLNLSKLGVLPFLPNILSDLLAQKYIGQITLIPETTISDYLSVLNNPDHDHFVKCIRATELSTWTSMNLLL